MKTIIILARHGKPAWDFRTPIPGRAFAEWRRGEDDAPLDAASTPGPRLLDLIRNAGHVITSPLRRSLDSVRLLSLPATVLTDPLFREAELPSAFRSSVRLRPDIWGVIARSRWFCGWSGGVESFAAARSRASRAAAMLVDLARAPGPVAVVGHGMINNLIAWHLRALGWRGPRIPSPRHWSFGVYTR